MRQVFNTTPHQRIFGLDLVRSLAIILVVISHYGTLVPAWRGDTPIYAVAACGGIGVALFFVLSGFLIGRLLIEIARRGPTFENLKVFLLRRWMRTVPLYVLWLCISVAVFPPLHDPAHHFFSYLTFSQNFAWPMPKSNWFGVSWSLTVEEWFYLLFSVCVIFSCRFLPGRSAFIPSLTLFLVLPTALRWQVPNTADFEGIVNEIVIHRLDSIAYGVLLALIVSFRPKFFRKPRLHAALGAIIIIGAWAAVTTGTVIVPLHVFRSFYVTVVSIGAMLLIAGLASWTTCRAPGASAVRGLSTISYGIYIVHLTILLDTWNWLPYGFWKAIAGSVIMTLGLAILSWRYFEQPILRHRPRQVFGPSTLTPALAVAPLD